MERELQANVDLWSLFRVICHLEDEESCSRFFRDLCTVGELNAMAERWAVVRLLQTGLPYREINEKTGASTATVTRIAHWLRYGEGGYREALSWLQQARGDGVG